MPEPITPELTQPQRLTIGETPVFFTSPLEVNGQQVTQLTLQGERTRGKDGLESAVLLIKEQSRRRGEEGVAFSKPLTNVNAMEEVDWDKVEGLQYTNPDGTVHTIPKEQLSLVKPEEPSSRVLEEVAAPTHEPTPIIPTPQSTEPKLARSILEKYSGEPTTLTIVGLKAYETRAHDLAAKSMQSKHEAPKNILRALDNLGENIWKHGIGPVYFQEKARQYYMDMLKASNSPFADSSIKIAEAAGKNRYQELLDNKNFLTRGSRRFIEWVKSSIGARTLAQQFALEEIAHMRESGEIKEMEAFEREGASIRKRFEMDFNAQDDVIRKTLGEKLDILDPTKAEHKPLVDDIRGLVRRYATGEIATKADFDKASDELFQTHLKGGRPDIFHEAELYSSSLYEVAETMRIKKDHVGGMEAIDAQLANMQVRLGMGVMGEATALEPTDVQRGTEMVQSILTGLEKKGIIGPFLLNEATVSSGVAVALSLAILPKTALSSTARFWGGFAGGVAIGAVFGGVREYRMLEREYLTHLREREAGLTFSPDAKRRAWMERFFVGQRSADDLITAINSDDVPTKLANLADAKARKALSSREHERNAQRVGLIQFSGRENIETQRTALDLTITQAEKDLLASGKTTEQFLADLTAAQTRILTEGASRVEGLSDPLKVTLNLLDKYNPEVEVIRRRFPLLGPEGATGAKAQGLEDILKEFRTAARGAAIKKGLQVGISGAIIGLGIREGLQLGSEVLSNITQHTPDLSAAVDVNPGQNFAFSNNLHMDGTGTNLVRDTVDGEKVVAARFKDYIGRVHGALNLDGTLSDNTKMWLAEQAQDNGVNLEFPEADKTEFIFSGSHPLDHVLPGRPIDAPDQLHWEITDHGRELRLDITDADSNPGYQVLYADAGRPPGDNPDAVLDTIKNHPFLRFTPEDVKEHIVDSQSLRVPGIPPLIDAANDPHFMTATIPQGMELNQTGDHTFALIDNVTGKHIIDGITIDDTGKILNEDALNKNDLGITFRSPTGELIHTTEASPLGDLFNKPVAEMGSEHGANGPWGWLEDPINADHTVAHALPGTNLAKNLFRGFEENYLPTPEHANYTSLNPGDVYHGLPKALFEDNQLVKLGHLMDEAIKMKEVDGTELADMDQLHQAAYEIGRVGRVATDKEVQMFIDALGGGTRETTVQLYQPIIEQITTETIPASIEGINGSVVTNIITMAERVPGDEFDWIPPLPLVGRRPLEPYEPLIPYTPPEAPPGELFPLLPKPSSVDNPTPFLSVWDPYGGRPESYGSKNGAESQKYTQEEIISYYRSRMHPDLAADPNARPDFDTAASWYLKQLDPAYRTALVNLNKTITAPMHNETQIAVCIPVRASQEGKHIYHTLEQYANQTTIDGTPLDTSKFEVVLFLNAPDKEPLDNTMDEVKRFMTDHPDMPVRVATGKFPKGAVRYGTYIKYAYDLALMRALERPNPAQKELLIATGDADLTQMEPTYLASNIAFMNDSKNANLDAALAAQDLENRALDAFPTFKAALRFSQYQEAQVRQGVPGWNTSLSTGPSYPYVQTQGRTTVLRGSTLAAIGGVNDASPAGADIELGRMINFARHGRFANISASDQTIAYNLGTNIETNARRELVTYLSGQPITHTWSKFDEGEDVRNKSTEELIALSKEKPNTINVRELERQINAFREWDVHMNSYYTKQALSWMGLKEGVDYVVEDDPTEAHKGGQWQKKITFTSDLSALASRIKGLPSEPERIQPHPSDA